MTENLQQQRSDYPRISSSAFHGCVLCKFTSVQNVKLQNLSITPKQASALPRLKPVHRSFATRINIMSNSLTTSTIPSDFKTAVVKPLLNKPSLDPSALNNYRPICNLPFLSKILEKIVLRQLLAQTETHDLFSVHQAA